MYKKTLKNVKKKNLNMYKKTLKITKNSKKILWGCSLVQNSKTTCVGNNFDKKICNTNCGMNKYGYNNNIHQL